MITALIIDDEPHCVEALSIRLADNCPEVKVIGHCGTVASGVDAITRSKPDLLFLDINLPDGSGFSLLEQVGEPTFQVIFTTAYDEFAIKAFKFNALDYLLKPVSDSDLRLAVDRYKSRGPAAHSYHHLRAMLDELKSSAGVKKIALPTSHGYMFVMIDDILRLQADSNYTIFFLKDGTRTVVAKTLKEYEEIFSDLSFVRIHNSDIVNLNYVKAYLKGKGGTVVLENGMEIEVSVRRKAILIDKMSHMLKN